MHAAALPACACSRTVIACSRMVMCLTSPAQ
jgi:hypothetical protein